MRASFSWPRVRSTLVFAVVFTGVLGVLNALHIGLVVNPSPSAPVGIYLHVPGEPQVGDWVAFNPDGMGLGVPEGLLLIKKFYHEGRGEYKLDGTEVYFNNELVATRKTENLKLGVDLRDVELTMEEGDAFLLNPIVINSYDSRYYGAVPRSRLSRLRLIWQKS